MTRKWLYFVGVTIDACKILVVYLGERTCWSYKIFRFATSTVQDGDDFRIVSKDTSSWPLAIKPTHSLIIAALPLSQMSVNSFSKANTCKWSARKLLQIPRFSRCFKTLYVDVIRSLAGVPIDHLLIDMRIHHQSKTNDQVWSCVQPCNKFKVIRSNWNSLDLSHIQSESCLTRKIPQLICPLWAHVFPNDMLHGVANNPQRFCAFASSSLG